MATTEKPKMGILVGGGPAPGINGVISAATIKAKLKGADVIGIYDGFKWLVEGDTTNQKKWTKELTIDDVARIHFDGGSILRTSRENPTKSKEAMNNVIQALTDLNIRYLVTIGGDDTAFSARKVCNKGQGRIKGFKVAHVPKTIDNDIPLPDNAPTFGFQTARHVGATLVRNIMEDSRTTNRWYFVEAMGRKAGHLALGMGFSTGATLTLIGEEFPEKRPLSQVCEILEGAIFKRRAMGRKYGVAVIAEGIAYKINIDELKEIPGVEIEYDPHGHPRLSEVNLASILKKQVQKRFEERGQKIAIVDLKFGYELRSATPIPFDCEYVRNLGYGAVEYLLNESPTPETKNGALVCLVGGRLKPLPFDTFKDPETGKTRVREVDIKSASYAVAYEYMIRLKREDFKDEEQVARLAEAAKMTPDEFKKQYGYLV